MRAYKCKECGYSYTEADKDWNYVNTKNPCPNCAFANTNEINKNAKKIKFSVLAIIIFLITLGVLTNDNSTEFNVGLIAAIWLFTSTYIFPFITKEDMVGWMTEIKYNQSNLEIRFCFMIFAVVITLFCLYQLLV